jgi:hypothetical protein
MGSRFRHIDGKTLSPKKLGFPQASPGRQPQLKLTPYNVAIRRDAGAKFEKGQPFPPLTPDGGCSGADGTPLTHPRTAVGEDASCTNNGQGGQLDAVPDRTRSSCSVVFTSFLGFVCRKTLKRLYSKEFATRTGPKV